ncbi:MAG: hypothetical protein KJZ65_05800 [Phycisphaerales bacterium]|nr:hypothetical protein [Phycisphaerales bacterium]
MHPYEYLALVVLHILGAAIWIGSLVSVLFGSIPLARKTGDLGPLKHVGKIVVGRLGLAALIVQILTGIRLATKWIVWSSIFSTPSGPGHLILSKIVLLVVVLALGGHIYHKTLSGLARERLGAFNTMTWVLLVLSSLIVIAGVGVRTGGLI